LDDINVLRELLSFLEKETNLAQVYQEKTLGELQKKLSLPKVLEIIDDQGSANVRVFRQMRKELVGSNSIEQRKRALSNNLLFSPTYFLPPIKSPKEGRNLRPLVTSSFQGSPVIKAAP